MSNFIPVHLAFNRYEPTGAESGEAPVLFLHGLSSCKESFFDLPQQIANSSGRTAYSVDLRNHGDSEWSETWSFDVNADDVLRFMDEHGIATAVLVGHSMGGIAAYKAALKAPDRVEGLFIEDISTTLFSPEIWKGLAQIQQMLLGLMDHVSPELEEQEVIQFVIKAINESVPTEMRPRMTMEQMSSIVRVRRAEDGRWAFKSNLDVLVRKLQSPGVDLLQAYEGLYHGPVSVACGDESPFKAHLDGDLIRQNFPNAEIVIFKGATHGPHLESAEEFKKALEEFLQKSASLQI